MPFFFTGCVHRSILPIRPSDFPFSSSPVLRKIRRFSGKKTNTAASPKAWFRRANPAYRRARLALCNISCCGILNYSVEAEQLSPVLLRQLCQPVKRTLRIRRIRRPMQIDDDRVLPNQKNNITDNGRNQTLRIPFAFHVVCLTTRVA